MKGKNTTNCSVDELGNFAQIQLKDKLSEIDFGDGQSYDRWSLQAKMRSDCSFKEMVINFFNMRRENLILDYGETGLFKKVILDVMKSRGYLRTTLSSLTDLAMKALPMFPDDVAYNPGKTGHNKYHHEVTRQIDHLIDDGLLKFEGRIGRDKLVKLVKYDLEAIKSNSKIKVA